MILIEQNNTAIILQSTFNIENKISILFHYRLRIKSSVSGGNEFEAFNLKMETSEFGQIGIGHNFDFSFGLNKDQ